MINITLIDISYFVSNIYLEYCKIFPKDEQRDFDKIERSYNNGVTKFYKIEKDNETIGFIILEKLDNLPYYIDYFAIYPKYQSMGYGSLSIKLLLEMLSDDICLEIDEVVDDVTLKRLKFYERLGFTKYNSKYSLYDVIFEPMINSNRSYSKEEIDKIMFSYYEYNCCDEVKNRCKILK